VQNKSPALLTREDANPDTPPLTLQERKQQLVKDTIWDAAIYLFDQKGYDETTVDDIAERAGVSRRSFFRYFSSKSDLMGHGIVGYATYLSEAIEACPPAYQVQEVFRHTVLQVAQRVSVHPRTRKIIQITTKYPAAREAQESRSAELQECVRKAFARRIKARSKDDLMPDVLGQLTISVLSVIFRSWYERDGKDISQTVDRVLASVSQIVVPDRRE
jgi:AcrR family transcriptional regulator